MRTLAELQHYLSLNYPELINPGIAVATMIFNDNNETLLIERGEKARDGAGKLEGVGGALDAGETDLHAALVREVREELGEAFTIAVGEVIDVKVLPSTNGQQTWVVVDYASKWISGEPHIPISEIGKINSVGFYPIEQVYGELFGRLTDYHKLTVNSYREKQL